MSGDTTSQDFFEQMYRRNPDPWNFASSNYEQGRYQAISNALCHRRYERAFEPGCSIGRLTARLAVFCDRVYGVDISPTAVQHARDHCRSMPHVEIACGMFPNSLPGGSFDLIVLSEIGYYFGAQEWNAIGLDMTNRIRPGGVLLAAHWTGVSEDHVLAGEDVHRALNRLEGLEHLHAEHHPGFLLDRWQRV
jgi:SAM-dependent methyltransferase